MTRFAESVLASSFEKGELVVEIRKEALLPVLGCLKAEHGFNALSDIIALDNMRHAADTRARFSVLYQLFKFPEAFRLRIKIELAEGETADSITGIYASADWAEREIFDMFGIRFAGHPDLRRIYMPDDFEGFPLRKDFPLKGKSDGL